MSTQRIDLTKPGDNSRSRYVEVLTPGGVIHIATGQVGVAINTGKPVVVIEIEPNTPLRRTTGPGGDWEAQFSQLDERAVVRLVRQDKP